MWTFCLRSEFCNVNALAFRSNTSRLSTTYKKNRVCVLRVFAFFSSSAREERKRCYVCGIDRKSNSYVKMKKRRNKKILYDTVHFNRKRRWKGKREEFKLLKLFSYVELPYQRNRERGSEWEGRRREQERFIGVSIEQNRLRIFSARAHVLLDLYIYMYMKYKKYTMKRKEKG
jgi:hypothetical protein